MSFAEAREELVEFARGHLLGPYGGDGEEVVELPYRRYLMGTLYPRGGDIGAGQEEEIQDEKGGSTRDEQADDPLVLANEWLPSSIGLSLFFAGDPTLEVSVAGARYESIGKSQWKRRQLGSDRVTVAKPSEGRDSPAVQVLEGNASLRLRWRTFADGWLVTASLVNNAEQDDPEGQTDPEACLHQVSITVEPMSGSIREYPSFDLLVADEEDEELALLHRSAKVFAIGHGCSTRWAAPVGGEVTSVATEFLPQHEVRGLAFELDGDATVLHLEYLADDARQLDELQAALSAFVDRYEVWIEALAAEHTDIPERLHPARDRLLRRLGVAAGRMRTGIEALADPDVLMSFRLAQRAMLVQMRHAQDDLGGRRRVRDEALDPDVSYDGLGYSWRPFQLGFMLLTLASTADVEHEDRDKVDLLWFPTGGGKTEAYLAIAAFVMVLRRLRHGTRGGGTAVITRYTLRLLATQQFQRSANLVCALEHLRRRGAGNGRLGTQRFTIGLWLGDDVSPNRWLSALERFEEMRSSPEPENPFQLETCPWCGTEIVPRAYEDDDAAYGVRCDATSFEFFCPNSRCEFSAGLPVQVVDESLYADPPAFLLGTVDKFARLAWEENAGALFGSGTAEPPDLIIQDELHLLSGPLGTLAGLYERAIDALIQVLGGRPKIIASTATIRRAGQQVRRLFARPVALFPPSGLSADDSYFSRTDFEKPGRLYVGVMSQSHTASTSLIQASTALLLGPVELGMTNPDRDGYWTLVAYHNTLRELGRSVTQFRDDVPEMLRARAKDESRSRNLGDESVVELTGNVSGARLPGLLARLFEPGESRAGVSVLATTSMLSVGVDVRRLGLMLVVGQPKSTSEYIQATSRVGRGATPGLVVTMLSATKPRDRSHYEGFAGYHQALYRHVEPASVTPFSLPARARALHAALVVLIRHGAGLSRNADASRFSADDPEVKHAVDVFKLAFVDVDADSAPDAEADVDELVEEWERRIREAGESGKQLHYSSGSKQIPSLLKNFGAAGEGWETPQSMRSVDRQCWVDVLASRGGST